MARWIPRCGIWLGLLLSLTTSGPAEAAEWSAKYIAGLPDSAFASVEATADKKTRRHLPHHDHSGTVDLPHLLNALARHSQVTWIDPASAAAALAHLKAHMQEIRAERLDRAGTRFPLDLNRATADELAELPFVGPGRAFAILKAREHRGQFRYVEELREVIGIGPVIFDAIKDLVTVGTD